VGAYARPEPGGQLHLSAAVTALDGTQQVTADASGPVGEPEKLGRTVADALRAKGAESILAAIRT
jgi:hydroxymethylbilane synthase